MGYPLRVHLTGPLGGAPTGWLATLVTCPHWKLLPVGSGPYLCPNGRCANRRALPGHGHPCRRRTFYRQHRSATGTSEAGDQLRLGAPARGVRSYRHAVAAGPLHHNWAVPHATRWHKLARNRYRLGLNCMQAPRRHTVRYSLLSSACLHYRHPARPSRWISSLGHAATGSTTKRWTGSPTSAGKSPQSNRIGLRLQGELPLTRSDNRELPSEGTCIGAIRVPANGQPVLFLADHPLTGGYPVIGAVAHYHLDIAGQLRPTARFAFGPFTRFYCF